MEEPPVHEAAEIFPLMNESDLQVLTDDISANGLVNPIILYEGKILDGRNRLEACKRAGVEPRFEDVNLNGAGVLEYVVTANLSNRHLSIPQRGAIAAMLMPELHTQALTRKKLIAQRKATKEELPGGGPSSGRAAELFEIGRTTVEKSERLALKSPEIAERMRRGEFVSVNQALRAAGIYHRGAGAVDDLPVKMYGRGDRWREVMKPMFLYLGGCRRRNFEFRHLNPAEARKRLKELAAIQEGLDLIQSDLELRAVKATTTVERK